MSQKECVETLSALGFTALEGEVYTALVQASPITAYRVAQTLGKPVANVYKTVESLQNKGAVLVEESSTGRLYRAIPPDELLSQLERKFSTLHTQATQAFSQLQKPLPDDSIYQLHAREQVFERCRSMLKRCQKIALFDVFPLPLKEIQDEIKEVACSQNVFIKVYEPVFIPGTEVIVASEGKELTERWPGQWLNVVIDASECLLALFSKDGLRVHQGIWSQSSYISFLYHNGLSCELCMSAIEMDMEQKQKLNHINKNHIKRRKNLLNFELPGVKTLFQNFGVFNNKSE